MQDADLEYDPADWPVLFEPIIDGRADACFGSRFLGGTHRVLYYWHSVGNRMLTTFSNMLTNLNLTDMETCYKAIRGDLARSIAPRLTADRFGFEPEITARLRKIGCAHLRGPDQLLRPNVCGRKEDRMEGRRRGVLAHHQVQSILMNVRWSRWASPLIAVLAFASSAVGIVNRFTYDDRYIIELNPLMRGLHGWWRVFQQSYWPKDWGGDGYRPLTILAFKLESAVSGRNPMLFHAVNIALYVAVCVLVFVLAKRFLPVWAAWITAALLRRASGARRGGGERCRPSGAHRRRRTHLGDDSIYA